MTGKGRGKHDSNGSDPKANRSARGRRLVSLGDKLARGKYRIDAKKVADKLVEDAVRDIRSKGH